MRSKFEERVAIDLTKRNAKYKYEDTRVSYTLTKTYVVDFTILLRGAKKIYVECKGRFRPGDQAKMLAVKACNPGMDIRFVFQKANLPLRKGAKTTHAEWADKHGFPWAEGTVPKEWL